LAPQLWASIASIAITGIDRRTHPGLHPRPHLEADRGEGRPEDARSHRSGGRAMSKTTGDVTVEKLIG
jgi:hypothetical protein